jgi:hypothetical protein
MKLVSYLLAFIFMMYAIVSFMYTDPASGKITATKESVVKGVLYLGLSLILAYVVSTN